MYFPTTHWSLLAKATLEGATEGRAALEELCRRYWSPINQFIRVHGYTIWKSDNLIVCSPVMDGDIDETAQPVPGSSLEIVTGRIVNVSGTAFFRLEVNTIEP